VFDLDLPPRTRPIDVQTFLYLMGDNPSRDYEGWDTGMAQGVERLLAARKNGKG
jgi:hypothetical protein